MQNIVCWALMQEQDECFQAGGDITERKIYHFVWFQALCELKTQTNLKEKKVHRSFKNHIS